MLKSEAVAYKIQVILIGCETVLGAYSEECIESQTML